MSLIISNLSKHFLTSAGKKTVLDGLSLEVEPGEVFALMGANGSGKTTLLKIISTLVLPSSGEVLACGINVVDSPAPAKRRIGLVCGADNSFYQMLTAEDNMRFFAGLYGVRSEAMEERIEELFEGLGLTDAGKESFGHLSSGMRQRLALARAMVSLPGVLLVDEASRSLDEDSAAKVSAYIKEYAGDNEAACVVVTHDRSWAKKYSIRSGTLVDGKIRTEITQ